MMGRRRDRWLASLARQITSADALRRVALDVRGLHASGSVRAIEELFRREPGRLQIAIHPSLSRVELWVAREFRIDRFVNAVERSGHRVSSARTRTATRAASLAARFAWCLALAGGAMLLTWPGGSAMRGLAAVGVAMLGAIALWVSAPLFARPAWRGLRRGRLTPELVHCLGLLCACAAAAWSAARGQTAAAFLVVALCVGGRALQAYLLERAARRQGERADGVLCRRIRGGKVELVDCGRVRRGDEILVAPGELVPVNASLPAGSDAELVIEHGWASEVAAGDAGDTGEHAGPRARRVEPGQRVPAGARNAGRCAARVVAVEAFSLSALLPVGSVAEPTEAGTGPRGHVIALLLAAAAGALLSLQAGRGAGALDVAAAILVAWPPGAFAVIHARHRITARLRRQGLLVRRPDFLDRAAAVRRVVIDRDALADTSLELRFPETLARLTRDERAALHHLAVHSPHPRCRAVLRALAREGSTALLDAAVGVESGRGVETEIDGALYRLGAPRWVVERGAAPAAGLGFSRDGHLLAWLVVDETVRPAAVAEVGTLVGQGLEPWLLSAADVARVNSLARQVDIPLDRARGGMQPADKAAWLAEHGGDALFLGDGINDGAVGGALVSGAPCAGRPLVAAADFHLVAPGLAPLASALAAARDLGVVARRSRNAGAACTAAAITLAVAGLASPVLIAALMPAAALAIAAATARPARPAAAQPAPTDYSPIGTARVSHSPV